MATVRFSDELKRRIRVNASNKMEPMVDKALQTRPSNDWAMTIYNRMFASEVAVISTLPNHWYETQQAFMVDYVGDEVVSLRFELPQKMPWPKHIPNTDIAKKGGGLYNNTNISIKRHEVWDDFLQEVDAYVSRLKTAQSRKKEFEEMVIELINSYTTLAPALKAWPALWELIPEDVKDRHREVRKKEKKEVELSVDVDKLTAMSTAAKFGV